METFIIISALGVIFCLLTVLTLTDVILKDFGTMKAKAIWGLVAMVPFAGWLVYLIFGFRKGKRIKFSDDPLK